MKIETKWKGFPGLWQIDSFWELDALTDDMDGKFFLRYFHLGPLTVRVQF